jgi:hypothetical protein
MSGTSISLAVLIDPPPTQLLGLPPFFSSPTRCKRHYKVALMLFLNLNIWGLRIV